MDALSTSVVLIVILMIGILIMLAQVVTALQDIRTQREEHHKAIMVNLEHLSESANQQESWAAKAYYHSGGM